MTLVKRDPFVREETQGSVEDTSRELVAFLRRMSPWPREHNRWVGRWRLDRATMLARRAARAAFQVTPGLKEGD